MDSRARLTRSMLGSHAEGPGPTPTHGGEAVSFGWFGA